MRKILPNSIALLGTYCLVMMATPVLWNLSQNNSVYYPTLTVIEFLGVLAMIYFAHKYAFKDQFMLKTLSLTKIKEVLYVVLGICAIFLAQAIGSFIDINVFGQTQYSANTGYLLTVLAKYPYFLLAVVLFAPIMEEFVFRKVLFANFANVIAPLSSALISSLIFSLAHQDGHYLTYMFMGLVLCFIYARTGKIRDTIMIHVFMNLIIVWSSL